MANMIRRENREPLPTTGWDPFNLMREMLSWDPFRQMGMPEAYTPPMRPFTPQFEVKETGEAYVIRCDVPGLEEKDLDVRLSGNQLTIAGQRQAEQHQEGEQWYALERSYGSFSRTFMLPDGVDLDHLDAELKAGVLTLTVPKKPEHQPRKVSIRNVVEKVRGAITGAKDKGSA
jgi:HSP20 family protein